MAKQKQCGTCSTPIFEGQEMQVVNNPARKFDSYFHANYQDCADAEQRAGARFARKHRNLVLLEMRSNVNIGLEGIRG